MSSIRFTRALNHTSIQQRRYLIDLFLTFDFTNTRVLEIYTTRVARHKEFDREEVLEKAMTTFWRYGYEGTSMQNLVASMGINRGSLYDTFGDKRALFQSAIAHYENTRMKELVAYLKAPGASKPAIVDLFNSLVEQSNRDQESCGCFLTNTAIELCPQDADTAKRIRTNLKNIEKAFKKTLINAREKGEISNEGDLDAISQYLTSSIQGLRVMVKVNQEPEFLKNIVRVILLVLN